MKTLALFLGAVLVAATPASADYLYTFGYAALSGPIESFSFSIDSPSLIGVGTPPFSAFTITDGSIVWTIGQDLVGISTGIVLGSTLLPAGDGCFSFGTVSAELAQYNGCAAALAYANGPIQAAFTVDIPGGLPSGAGTFSNLIFDGITTASNEGFENCCGVQPTGILNLAVTQTPEPSSLVLLVAGICMVALVSQPNLRKPAAVRSRDRCGRTNQNH